MQHRFRKFRQSRAIATRYDEIQGNFLPTIRAAPMAICPAWQVTSASAWR